MAIPKLLHGLYCRKSSKPEDRQALSIEAQEYEMGQLAGREDRLIKRTFRESMSALKPGRPDFNEMIACIERGQLNAILVWKIDRLARNFDDAAKIISLLQSGRIQEIRTIEKVYLPTDNVLMLAIEFGIANQYSRDLSVTIRRGIREKVRKGVYFGKAPLGYYNEPKLRTIEPNPQTFKKVKRILERFATGEYSLTAIQREMATAGLVGIRSKKPLPLSSIGNMLRNPFFLRSVYTQR